MPKVTQRPHKARYTPEEIDQILLAYDASGLGLTQFAKQHQIAVSTFHSWLCRRRDQASSDKQPPALIPVTVRPNPAVSAGPSRIEVTLANLLIGISPSRNHVKLLEPPFSLSSAR